MQKEYDVKLSFNEMDLILRSLDLFVEENRPSVPFEVAASIQEKLEPIHREHIYAHRDKLWDKLSSASDE